ncbi:MAG: tryptophan synthase subunit alpha [Bacteroidales bacterium]|nr:tryptophan synthase subunit alpha [Bacteroidales bacterium]
MNRIDRLFEEKKNGILSVYFTAGYPQLDDTPKVIKALEDRGVNLIEIGVPFSDPMADGPVIQASGAQALENGMSVKHLFRQLAGIREEVSIPLVLMGYINPIIQFGFENYCAEAVKCGVDGLIIPDLPFAEYMAGFKPIAEKHGLHIIMLITPETSEERIRLIDAHTSGFIYMVSTASVTGAKNSFGEESLAYFRRVNAMRLKNPRLIGFGISNKETFDAACREASGAIIGSKFISLLGSEKTIDDAAMKLVETLETALPDHG